MRAAAEHLTPMTCELGGKDAMLVLEDADVAAAAEWGAWGAFYNAGQTCMAVERAYVHHSVYPAFLEHAVRAAGQLRLGYSLDPAARNQIGPLTCGHQMEVVELQMADALSKGARVAAGGRRTGQFFEPTVLVDVTPDMLVMREETFGPILPIVRVENEEEAIRLANDSPFGLSASVWSRDQERAKAVAARLQTGSVIINDTLAHFGVPQMPFGGVKESGFGRIHGKAGLLQFTQPRAMASGGPPMALDVATVLRRPGNYKLGAALLQMVFGVTPRRRMGPVTELFKDPSERSQFARLGLGLGAAGLLAAMALSFGGRRQRRHR
jgi:acyl-CoA reductase-like NAD-dependent aldehyde dehydrogenase